MEVGKVKKGFSWLIEESIHISARHRLSGSGCTAGSLCLVKPIVVDAGGAQVFFRFPHVILMAVSLPVDEIFLSAIQLQTVGKYGINEVLVGVSIDSRWRA